MLKDLIKKCRSYRRFDENKAIGREELIELIDLARLSSSAANRQPLKYYLSYAQDSNNNIFGTLAWAGYLKDWDGPAQGERPTGYIVILGDKNIAESFNIDPGIAAQSIMLGAVERGMGGCIIASVDREELRTLLTIPAQYEILYVLAIGYPVEKVEIEEVGPDGDIKYWRDSDGVHHVPKRKISEIIISP
ncbi:MAG TPA: nitroreductase family protein [Atribacterota bacterium]|nr:nitroreductase family protein [Atribacterota bacterium]HOR42629.1 nitroreductase family protein [Atribacterota bacterium]